jgi:hypothetical protein
MPAKVWASGRLVGRRVIPRYLPDLGQLMDQVLRGRAKRATAKAGSGQFHHHPSIQMLVVRRCRARLRSKRSHVPVLGDDAHAAMCRASPNSHRLQRPPARRPSALGPGLNCDSLAGEPQPRRGNVRSIGPSRQPAAVTDGQCCRHVASIHLVFDAYARPLRASRGSRSGPIGSTGQLGSATCHGRTSWRGCALHSLHWQRQAGWPTLDPRRLPHISLHRNCTARTDNHLATYQRRP